MKRRGSTKFALLWVGFWSLITLGFDCTIAYNAFRNVRAQGFAVTDGVVTVSDVERKRGSKGGTTYDLKIRYDYSVNGVKHTGDKYRYGQMSSSDKWAFTASREHPVGSKVRVHYDPSDPTSAVLQTGIQGMDLFMALFLTPFNIIMLGGWYFVGAGFIGGRNWFSERREAWESRMRVPTITPLAAFAVTLLAVSFVSIFIVGFTAGFYAPLRLMVLWWVGMLAVSFAVAVKVSLKLASGARDLVVDERRKTLTLPMTLGRKEPVTLKCEQVQCIAIDEEIHRSSKGGKTVTHIVAIRWRDEEGKERSDKVAKIWKQEEAEKLAAALRKWLKVREGEAATA